MLAAKRVQIMTRQQRNRNAAANTAGQNSWLALADLHSDRRVTRLLEHEFRLEILNALLRTPHGDLEPFIPPFRYIHDRDPLFFARLAAWYCEMGTVHDLKLLFIAFLCTSRFSDSFREAGLVLLEKLPPFQVERVLHLIKGHDDGTNFKAGLGVSVPRSFKTAVVRYLRTREANQNSFESAVLHARESLITLYTSLRIKPSEFAQRVLFDDDPPEDSRLHGLKLLAWTHSSEEQAMLIVQHRLPYRAAVSSIKYISPPILIALVDVMSPQELINNLNSLKNRGALDNPDVRALIECKLEDARSDKRVSALKTRQALKSASLTGDLADKVAAVGDAQIKAKGSIGRSTALFVDKSASMEEAIELGKQIASILAPVCTADLHVYAFDSIPYKISAEGKELSHWEKAFAGIRANGSTSCGTALEALLKAKKKVEQIIIVTDQEENAQPFLATVCKRYEREFGEMPFVVIVNVGNHSKQLEDSLKAAGVQVDTYTFNGDYYSLPSLIPLLSEGTRADLLIEIMSYPLPERELSNDGTKT